MKTYFRSSQYCIDCNAPLRNEVHRYALQHFQLSLCIPCQDKLKLKMQKATKSSVKLYVALRKRHVPAELEKWDGHKTIDIAVTHARVNIEVDGLQHNFSPKQAMSDLKRTFFAFKRGYLTLRIPNTLVEYHLEETADYITEFLMESVEQLVEV